MVYLRMQHETLSIVQVTWLHVCKEYICFQQTKCYFVKQKFENKLKFKMMARNEFRKILGTTIYAFTII